MLKLICLKVVGDQGENSGACSEVDLQDDDLSIKSFGDLSISNSTRLTKSINLSFKGNEIMSKSYLFNM